MIRLKKMTEDVAAAVSENSISSEFLTFLKRFRDCSALDDFALLQIAVPNFKQLFASD